VHLRLAWLHGDVLRADAARVALVADLLLQAACGRSRVHSRLGLVRDAAHCSQHADALENQLKDLRRGLNMPAAGNALGVEDNAMRFRVEPRDVPPETAARRLGKSLAEFDTVLPNLIARGFPKPDPDTGNFDLHAIDRWRDARHSHLFGDGATMQARDAGVVAKDRIAAMRRGAA
jgi:hypothetical protein